MYDANATTTTTSTRPHSTADAHKRTYRPETRWTRCKQCAIASEGMKTFKIIFQKKRVQTRINSDTDDIYFARAVPDIKTVMVLENFIFVSFCFLRFLFFFCAWKLLVWNSSRCISGSLLNDYWRAMNFLIINEIFVRNWSAIATTLACTNYISWIRDNIYRTHMERLTFSDYFRFGGNSYI